MCCKKSHFFNDGNSFCTELLIILNNLILLIFMTYLSVHSIHHLQNPLDVHNIFCHWNTHEGSMNSSPYTSFSVAILFNFIKKFQIDALFDFLTDYFYELSERKTCLLQMMFNKEVKTQVNWLVTFVHWSMDTT